MLWQRERERENMKNDVMAAIER